MNDVSDDEELYKAAVASYLFHLFDLYAQVGRRDKEHNDILEKEIIGHREIVLHNQESSKLLRIMTGMSYFSFGMVRIAGRMYKKFLYFYSKMR